MKVLYVVYWGAAEPLGQSLVLPAVRKLADLGAELTLVTFEKPDDLARLEEMARIRASLNKHGVRKYGIIRIDSADSPSHWDADPKGNTKKIAATFREAAKVAKDNGERLAAEGEICWAGMHSWKHMIDLLYEVDLPESVGFQADQAHT